MVTGCFISSNFFPFKTVTVLLLSSAQDHRKKRLRPLQVTRLTDVLFPSVPDSKTSSKLRPLSAPLVLMYFIAAGCSGSLLDLILATSSSDDYTVSEGDIQIAQN